MDVFKIQGGNSLCGTVAVSGSKNAALPMMAAALLTDGKTILNNVPDLVDVRTLSSLLTSLGCEISRHGSGSLSLEVVDESHSEADYELVRKMRASVCVMGPLLARRGHARVSLPGGCNIGHRPIDIHLRGFAALGAQVDIHQGDIIVQATQLRGAEIDLAGPNGSTVTGTCNLLTAAVLAQGKSRLTSAAMEPEVVALADLLNEMGAKITGQGTPTLEVEGVSKLTPTTQAVIPDRIEAATLMIASALTRGQLTIQNVNPQHLSAVTAVLQEMGVSIYESGLSQLEIACERELAPVNITALPYPGIPTDIQAQLTALLCTLPGRSVIRDQVFPDRFMHCAELNRMNAKIRQQGDRAFITGVAQLQGAHVMASDLRASAALVLAALAARDETVIHRIYHLDRGYEALETKLNFLGANVTRCREEDVQRRTPIERPDLRRSA
ncbi:UDP-N-acetylglucosamine 1-carboxyvinyltransferase [Thalassoglobus polymorphus]|uniref:UDP-N-acetylglucosamine 1-carboxyvinyltransferase n=1 Tax=Thalassoglobus polymorphus TaxID=2527994 RepID=A0A517QJP6_9PLAN|nr:UDP-N-acetylglucosamine 1-carboxyvinyltransferase [Thalassoglobus polymorphus]QDT31866.1 UDP-N-acetylglucosamine 1-carboxyvinyltransferase MurA [Thalassoglobus polymorphus]